MDPHREVSFTIYLQEQNLDALESLLYQVSACGVCQDLRSSDTVSRVGVDSSSRAL